MTLATPHRRKRSRHVALVALFTASLAACTGFLGDPGENAQDGPGGPDDGDGTTRPESFEKVAPRLLYPRLTHTQWENTVRDLFKLDAPLGLSGAFAPDAQLGAMFSNNEATLDVEPTLWAAYQRAAEEVAKTIAGDAALLAKITPEGMPADLEGQARAFVDAFGLRAFRRPLESAELDSYEALFLAGQGVDDAGAAPFAAGAKLVIEAMLQSPNFIYRPEDRGTVRPDALVQLTGYEIASRLSYTLWNTMPDEVLFDAARAGTLDTKEGIEGIAKNMLADARTVRTLVSFHEELYETEKYAEIDKSTTAFPSFDPAVGADMQRELEMFVEKIIADGGGLKDLLTSRTTFVNARLAAIYGLPTDGLTNDTFKEVTLDPAQRSGLLTRAGFLAWKGTKFEPDLILRGVFIARKILCTPLGDPPDEAMGAMLGGEKTNRQRVESLTGVGTCGASCHGVYINPAGAAFEHYDAFGQYRSTDNGEPVDAAASYPFASGAQSFTDAITFSDVAAASEDAHMCYGRSWIEFAQGRDKTAEDQFMIDELEALSLGGGSIRDVVLSIVTSDGFMTRIPSEE